MRKTLRRSCAACAKAKLGCDLRTPTCSRCVKKSYSCVYANEPLNAVSNGLEVPQTENQTLTVFKPRGEPPLFDGSLQQACPDTLETPVSFEAHLLDPFDSYPVTNLPRLRIQGLMQHFLTKIAFQYYPLDLNPASNPFVASWWPLALTDPLLFHVTLQTASWDDEFQSGNGFAHSEILMSDSVSLLRHKIQHKSLAFQDETINAVITLAAIEHGKGHLDVSKMHVDGVKRMVDIRGGLVKIKQTSPITARMVPWVSLLITGSPQFETKGDDGTGHGISAIQQWQCDLPMEYCLPNLLDLSELGIDPILEIILTRIRTIFGTLDSSDSPWTLSSTDLHDLSCFVLHRLLDSNSFKSHDSRSAKISECLRYGASIYIFIIHGPTYYSHATILQSLLLQLKYHLEFTILLDPPESLLLWLLSVGAVAATGINESRWFREQLNTLCTELELRQWKDLKRHLKRILWLQTRAEDLFQHLWKEIIT